jgi:acyl-ACP thioesterase
MESAGGSAAAWPGWKSELTVATWPSGLGRLVCLRDYQVADRAGRVLARARSWWLVMDMASRKVVRVPDAIVAAIPASPPAPREQSPLAGLPPLHGDTDATARIAFPVRRSDLDVNRHVNNTRYIAWAVEAVPEPVRLACRPSCLDISFKAETGYGDTVLSRCDPLGPDHPGVFRHSLTLAPYSPNDPGGREAAQALTTWAALEEEPAS